MSEIHPKNLQIQELFSSIVEKISSRMEFCSLAEKLSPLQIPGLGKRILQIDASDEYWVVALFEEVDGKRMAIKVVHSSLQNFITTLPSKKSL